jgi:regulator of nucleoside diphosphate kinase
MGQRTLYITAYDKDRLDDLLAEARARGEHHLRDLDELATELKEARVVDPKSIPRGVVTMNSRVSLREAGTAEERVYSLVFPQHANVKAGAISVLAPLGTALLGYTEGDEIEWPMPSGRTKRFRIEKVIYQPEAAGAFHL